MDAAGPVGGAAISSDCAPKLEEAVVAYREALIERTRERVPLDWAMTQNNLGNALLTLGQRETGTTKLEEPVAAYREALKERSRRRREFRTIAVCNVGDCDLHVTKVAFEHKNRHWRLVHNPFPATLHPGVARYLREAGLLK